MSDSDWVVFGLAFAAYALLGADVVLHAWKRPRRLLSIATAAVLIAHVGLVWGVRFGWSMDIALAKGLAGFLIFHAAFLTIVAAAAAPEPWSGRLVFAAYPVASVGGLGAAFTYDYVAMLRIPLILVLCGTLVAAAAATLRPGR